MNFRTFLIGAATFCLAQTSLVAGQRRPAAPSPYAGAFSDTAHAANERAARAFRIQQCAQSPGRRNGYCLATHAPDLDVAAALGPLRASVEPESAAREWAHSGNSGCALSGWLRAHVGARGYTIPSQVFARNGTRLHRIWVDGSDACFDLSVPR